MFFLHSQDPKNSSLPFTPLTCEVICSTFILILLHFWVAVYCLLNTLRTCTDYAREINTWSLAAIGAPCYNENGAEKKPIN